nr:PcfJ domain-containing protein [Dorea longicatena]
MNYISRQQKEQYPGFTEEAVLEQYNDYLSMCKACNKNMQDELTYRPRELKRRHDEIVIDKQQMDILKEMMASQAEREQYAQEMREKYPTAEQTLHEIKERYEYENEEYKIIVPESLVDIVKEGRALHHCAGSSERYFDRIETRETYICFLRRKEQEGVPFYTIEVEPSGTIRQHRSYMDEEPGIEQIRDFLKEWQRVLKKRLTKADKELAKISKEKRNANIEDLKAKNNTRVLQGLAEDFMDAEEIEELLEKAV